MDNFKKLDNPVWHSLCETHKKIALDFEGMKFYRPEFCAFGSFMGSNNIEKAMKTYSKLVDSFYIVSKTIPKHPNVLTLQKAVSCEQMILNLPSDLILLEPDSSIVKLTKAHEKELYELIMLVMPGTYREKSFEIGDYYGIFKNNLLVAATGERLQTNSFIEISGVVTHPDYIRRGFAKKLVHYTSKQIIKKNKTPILHVMDTNFGAIKLYKDLGFQITDKIFWIYYTKNN